MPRPVLRLATRLTRRTRTTAWAIAFACMVLVGTLSLADGFANGVGSVADRIGSGRAPSALTFSPVPRYVGPRPRGSPCGNGPRARRIRPGDRHERDLGSVDGFAVGSDTTGCGRRGRLRPRGRRADPGHVATPRPRHRPRDRPPGVRGDVPRS